MTMPNWKRLAIGGASSAVLLGALIGYFEPSSTPGVPYQDVTGKWTNCLGNTHDVDPKLFYTSDQCKVIDGENQSEDFSVVRKDIHVPLTPGQEAAFADFVHNAGSGNFEHSSMLRVLNQGNYKLACAKLLDWVYAGGKILNGLVIRRNAEYQMCTAKE